MHICRERRPSWYLPLSSLQDSPTPDLPSDVLSHTVFLQQALSKHHVVSPRLPLSAYWLIRAWAFRVLFSFMTTTQLWTPGESTSPDKSFPAIKDFVSSSTHTDGWSILDDSVGGGLATELVDFAFCLRIAGKCKPISLKRLREEWHDLNKKQWIKRVSHDVFNLFFAMSKLATPLEADRNISDHPSLDCLTKR